MRIFLLSLIVFILSACQPNQDVDPQSSSKGKLKSWAPTHYRYKNDSAPKGVIPAHFKEQTPKNEPLSRYGNPSNYQVAGQQYNVLTSSTGYKARGITSWYGTKFNKERTSSGERYDMYALTAAHKTLPIPTYIKVKNLENGKEAIVKVNDRGPFHSTRILDLSYGAAVKLGIFPRGTAQIEIEALTPRGGAKRLAHYYIQAGAFQSEALAMSLKNKIVHLTTSPVLIEQFKDRYIVEVGPFADIKMSSLLKDKLRQQGVSGAFSVLR